MYNLPKQVVLNSNDSQKFEEQKQQNELIIKQNEEIIALLNANKDKSITEHLKDILSKKIF